MMIKNSTINNDKKIRVAFLLFGCIFIAILSIVGIMIHSLEFIVSTSLMVIIGTAIAYSVFFANTRRLNAMERIIFIGNNAELDKIQTKYIILENLGRGLYRVAPRSIEESGVRTSWKE